MAEQTIIPEQLAQLTGIHADELRVLARKGYFPKLKAGVYQQASAVIGCFRFRKEQAEKSGALPVFTGMAQCAGATGIPLSALKQAKKSGCDAFKWNRVALAPLLKWLFSQSGDDQDWDRHLKKFQSLREEIRYQRDHDETLDKAEASLAIKKVMALLFASLDRHSDTLPAILHGMDANGIKAKLLETNGEMREQIGSGLKELAK